MDGWMDGWDGMGWDGMEFNLVKEMAQCSRSTSANSSSQS
jgi:hypothetical protein